MGGGASSMEKGNGVEGGETTKDLAILSVWDKTGLEELGRGLAEVGLGLVASGGTAKALRAVGLDVEEVEELTGSPEMLGGRVKTLHPVIHGGILAQTDLSSDAEDLEQNDIQPIQLVVCNLYPFERTVAKEGVSLAEAVENMDIGGVTLLRAAAKNHKRVTVLSDPADYAAVLAEVREEGLTSAETRSRLALKAFEQTAAYDAAISAYLRGLSGGSLPLRYGMNPHQKPALLSALQGGSLPLNVLNGAPGYVNILDALNGWALVRELSAALEGRPAAASFKHVSPAGAAVGVPLSEGEAAACMVEDPSQLSELATAYARARGADRLSSFGDFVALSHPCDLSTAQLLKAEVSDGVIAPGFHPEALELLKTKKGGKYCVLEMEATFQPAEMEERTVFGLRLTQKRNDARVTRELLGEPLTGAAVGEAGVRDLVVATVAVKYAQSNSVCLALNGQVIGMGAGQQSRIHCTRLAGEKAQNFWLRQHVSLRSLPFVEGLSRAERTNATEQLLRLGEEEEGDAEWAALFARPPLRLAAELRRAWLGLLSEVALSSDAFFPFPDNVHAAAAFGVSLIASPGGSSNDQAIIDAAKTHRIALFHTATRLFHH